MDLRKILDTYKKMGIGTQEERNNFLQWSLDQNNNKNNLIFIVESPNSETLKEEANAQLARNPK